MENNLTEEQKALICEWLDKFDNEIGFDMTEFIEHYNLLPTPKIEVGKYYKDKFDRIIYVTKVHLDSFDGYGIDALGNWNTTPAWNFKLDWQPITQEEWIEVLKKEGDKYIGKTVKCLYDDRNYVVRKFSSFTKTGNLYYCTEENTNVCLMKDGVWATVVSDENLDKISELQMKLDKLQDAINELSK